MSHAAVKVVPLIPDDDPAWSAALRAPVVEETDEERAMYEEARALGGFADTATVMAGLERRRSAGK